MTPLVDEAFDFIFERARATFEVMVQLQAAPFAWQWHGLSPNNYNDMITALDAQLVVVTDLEAATSVAAAQWDHDISVLLADAVLGSALARVKWKANPVRLHLFQGLRNGGGGREESYRQALDFESSWRAADPAWVFQPPLTLTVFKQRREALRTREDAHVTAAKNESRERSLFHVMANDVNAIAVDWYETATAWFGPNTVAGALVRTIPTTYDPARPPGALVFTESLSPAPNQVQLRWRAPRGEKFFLNARGPGQSEWQTILENSTGKEWVGLGLNAGEWEFEGWATNQFGAGPASGILTVNVAATAVA